MKQFLTIIFFFTVLFNYGQRGNGIYRGQKLPFLICYVTLHDTISAIEFFYEKGGQIFGHRKVEKLVETKNGFKTIDDSIKVIRADKYLLMKSKKHPGKIKLYPSTHQRSEIYDLRRRNNEFRHYQDSVKTVGQETDRNSR